jgi:hypothetical protein
VLIKISSQIYNFSQVNSSSNIFQQSPGPPRARPDQHALCMLLNRFALNDGRLESGHSPHSMAHSDLSALFTFPNWRSDIT